MKKICIWLSGTAAILICVVVGTLFWPAERNGTLNNKVEVFEPDPIQTKIDRSEYFFQLLRDPATNSIPENIRSRELKHAKQVRGGGDFFRKGQAAQQEPDITWQSAGPIDLGGRTRALGIDQRNSDIILAGGVSGGVWKSTDAGSTWQLKTDPNQNMSVSSLAQDPTNPDTWYYATGVYPLGNSASDRGNTAGYYGTGIYKSTDNGETWSLLSSTEDSDTSWNSQFDYISRIIVHPLNGNIYFASNGVGIYRSTDGGNNFQRIFGGPMGGHRYIDIIINKEGDLLAVLSENGAGSTPDNTPGIYQSTDNGDSWTDVTPSDFPTFHDRTVLAFAPSAPDTAYVFSYEGTGSGSDEDVSFFMLDLVNDDSEDRSDNLPDFGGSVGFVNTQSNYNMVVSVKPDNPDFVMVGGTNLFRSRDGFATAPADTNNDGLSDDSEKDEYWIGGYAKANNVSQYPQQHPDQHVIVYNPDNPDEVWSGHDGGLSLTNDVTASAVTWQDKDEGYVTGQFYTVAIPADENDDRFLGGTQDNGTPFFRFSSDNGQLTDMLDISSGDGAYAFWGKNYAYVSTQNGEVTRIGIESDGDLTSPYNSSSTDWSDIYPANAKNQLFIHPYAIDPNDEGIMYYPGDSTMWRNTEVDQLNSYISGGTTTGWESLEAVSSKYTITALHVSKSQPAGRLYYAAYNSSLTPKIFSVENASSSWNPVDISISGASSGAYVHDIAVNPNNSDELIAVMSNYNILGLYHSTDGGSSWTAIEGNLEGDAQNPGPSLRSATILPTSSKPIYFVGTSTGVYSATSLSGSSTSWTRESDDGTPGSIGYSIAEYITSRPSDGTIAVGSHGRGIFMGSVGSAEKDPNDTTPPASPSGLITESADGDIKIAWDANTENDLDKYRVYRGNDVDELVLHDSTSSSSTSFQDTNAEFKTYFYRVTAVDVNGNESDSSNATAVVRNYLTVDDQWRLVGTPLIESAAELPDDSEVFSFNGAYQVANSFDTKSGFWIKKAEKDSIKYNGTAFTDANTTLESGWNLIGGIADTISTTDISDPDDILSSSPIYEYTGGSYDEADRIKPLTGYWIHANKAGDIGLAVKGESSSSSKERLAKAGQSMDKLEFRQGAAAQLFYLTGGSAERDERNMFRMPPQSPSPVLDVRSTDGFRLAAGEKTQLKLTTERYPVNVKLSEHSTSSYTLKGITNQDTVVYKLSPGKMKSIQKPQYKWLIVNASSDQFITENELLPNYPNPFNPSTNIVYKIASQTHVSLAVYDVLGRRVRILVDEVQEPGQYTKTFDARNLSSGTYFIRIRAQDFSRVQQMTLIK